MSRNAFWTGLVALVGLGALLRVAGLDQQSFWVDEIASLAMSQDRLLGEFPRLRIDVHPPLYFLLLGLWTDLFGTSESAVRMLSVLPSLASIGVMARLGTRLYDARVGLVAAGLASLSLLQIYYAQEGRSYAWFILFGLLSTDALVRWRMRGRSTSAVAYTGWTTALVYTHYFGFFLVAAQAAFMLGVALRGRGLPDDNGFSPRAALAGWALATLAIGVLFLPWLPFLLDQIQRVREDFWIGSPTLGALLRVPLFFLSCIGPWHPRASVGVSGAGVEATAASIILAFAGLAVLFWAAGAWQGRRPPALDRLLPTSAHLPHREAAGLLWLWFLLPPVAGFALSGFGLDVFTYRNTVISAPALLLLLAGSLRQLASPLARGVLLAALIAPSVGQLPFYYGELHKDPWREVGDHLAASFDPERDALAFDAPFIRRSFDYYSPLASYREVEILEAPPGDVQRVWLIRAYAGPKSRSPEFITRWGFPESERKDFLHIEVHRFDRNPEAKDSASDETAKPNP